MHPWTAGLRPPGRLSLMPASSRKSPRKPQHAGHHGCRCRSAGAGCDTRCRAAVVKAARCLSSAAMCRRSAVLQAQLIRDRALRVSEARRDIGHTGPELHRATQWPPIRHYAPRAADPWRAFAAVRSPGGSRHRTVVRNWSCRSPRVACVRTGTKGQPDSDIRSRHRGRSPFSRTWRLRCERGRL